MWQYGDGDLHGWVYDSSLKVTCPTDQCSVLKCGFRADCVRDQVRDQAAANSTRCQCQKGFSGNPYERCYPDDPLMPCACQKLKLYSTGPASEHQVIIDILLRDSILIILLQMIQFSSNDLFRLSLPNTCSIHF